MYHLKNQDIFPLNGNGLSEPMGRPSMPRRRFLGRPNKILAMETLPLIEDAKTEMSLLPTKTPVSILQELLSRRGSTPKYELVQIEGAIHEPTFRYRVTVADTVEIKVSVIANRTRERTEYCRPRKTSEWQESVSRVDEMKGKSKATLGTGRSKKEAKHAAAKNVLEKLVGNAVNDDSNGGAGLAPASQTVNSYDKISGNPIGTLQEMCISRRWPPPTYEMTCEEGLPHERQFTITCTVFKYHEVGSGKSKKLAKREAAYKMWEKLQECPLDSSQFSYGGELDLGINSGSNRYADVKNSKILTLTTPHSHKVSNFHRNLKQNSGEKLNELQAVHLNGKTFNHIEFLQEIASEQQFEVTYVDIEEKSLTGKCQCLVQLSTLPVAVCYGAADTSKEAQSAAAHNALEYLKIMTKK